MEADKRLEILEDDLKLIKGEVKQTLASVRDYLLNMELPASEFATILQALGDGGGGNQRIQMKGVFEDRKKPDLKDLLPEETAPDELSGDEEQKEEEAGEEAPESLASDSAPPEDNEGLVDQNEPSMPDSELAPDEQMVDDDGNLRQSPEDMAYNDEEEEGEEEEAQEGEEEPGGPVDELGELGDGLDELGEPGEEESENEERALPAPGMELPAEEERQMEQARYIAELNPPTPRVNMLANLIHWVAKAKKEIGAEQLPVFLEVYGISGHLTDELKEAILHLADITSEEPEDTNTAEIWSQSMLALHGTLTGGDAPLHPFRPSWNNGEEQEAGVMETGLAEEIPAAEEPPKDRPIKLKLVFPNGGGKGKEYCISLNPEDEDNGA